MHDRDDEPLLGLDCDADVVALEQDQLSFTHARVQLRVLAERCCDGLEDERDEQLQLHVREVALLHPRHGRDLVSPREVLEHLPPDPVQLDTCPLGTCLGN